MKNVSRLLLLICLFPIGCKKWANKPFETAEVKVINGKEEGTTSQFKSTQQLILWDGKQVGQYSYCSGTFLTDRLVLTAAHCLEGVTTIWIQNKSGYIGIDRTDRNVYVHDKYKTDDIRTPYDYALVIFPFDTFVKENFDNDHRYPVQFPVISRKAVVAGDEVKIVGFGKSSMSIASKFCRLEDDSRTAIGKCRLMVHMRQSDMTYNTDLVEEYTPLDGSLTCSLDNLMAYVGQTYPLPVRDLKPVNGTPWSRYIGPRCGIYSETGIQYLDAKKDPKDVPRRSGTNTVDSVSDGLITVSRPIETGVNRKAGEDVVAGPGDSGGPIFYRTAGETQWKLVGVAARRGDPTVQGTGDALAYSEHGEFLFTENRCWIEKIATNRGFTLPYEDDATVTLPACPTGTETTATEPGTTDPVSSGSSTEASTLQGQ